MLPVEKLGDARRLELRTHRSRHPHQRHLRTLSSGGTGERDEHPEHSVVDRAEYLDGGAVQLDDVLGGIHRSPSGRNELLTGIEAKIPRDNQTSGIHVAIDPPQAAHVQGEHLDIAPGVLYSNRHLSVTTQPDSARRPWLDDGPPSDPTGERDNPGTMRTHP